LLVVCLAFVQWPTTVTAKEPHGKKKNLTAKRKTSWQKAKPHGKKEKTHDKKQTSRQKEKRLTAKFIRCREDIFILFFFFREVVVFLFVASLFPFVMTVVGHLTFEILFTKILDFFNVCIREN